MKISLRIGPSTFPWTWKKERKEMVAFQEYYSSRKEEFSSAPKPVALSEWKKIYNERRDWLVMARILRRVRKIVSKNRPPCLSLIRAAKERKLRGWHGNSLKNLLMSCSFRVCNLPGKNVSWPGRVHVVTFTWGEGKKKNSLVERFQLQQQRPIVGHIVGDIAAHPVTMLSQGRGIIGGHLVITDVRAVRDTWNKWREKERRSFR